MAHDKGESFVMAMANEARVSEMRHDSNWKCIQISGQPCWSEMCISDTHTYSCRVPVSGSGHFLALSRQEKTGLLLLPTSCEPLGEGTTFSIVT